MGALALTGIATFGAAIGIGLIVAGTFPEPLTTGRVAPPGRALAIILMAFCEGIGVLGVVIGILAVELTTTAPRGDVMLAAGPGVAGALIGLAIIFRNRPNADPRLSTLGMSFIVGLAMLGMVVAILGSIFDETPSRVSIANTFVVLGFICGAAAVVMGMIGGRAVGSIQGADASEILRIRARTISRAAILEFAAVTAIASAIVLIVTR